MLYLILSTMNIIDIAKCYKGGKLLTVDYPLIFFISIFD